MAQCWRVLIVDDHPVVRRGLRAMLQGEHWVGEVAEAAGVAEALRVAVSQRAQVIAMDVALPDGDGVDATQRIMRSCPDAKVLMLTMSGEAELVARALRAGARGYLLKDSEPDLVVDSLRAVANGGVVLGPRVGTELLHALPSAPGRLPPPLDRLTDRERDMLAHLAAGDSNARIARHLGLSEKTVRNQLSGMFAKLGVTGRVPAALLAQKAGILADPAASDLFRFRPPQRDIRP